jgi:hypothetical protein
MKAINSQFLGSALSSSKEEKRTFAAIRSVFLHSFFFSFSGSSFFISMRYVHTSLQEKLWTNIFYQAYTCFEFKDLTSTCFVGSFPTIYFFDLLDSFFDIFQTKKIIAFE